MKTETAKKIVNSFKEQNGPTLSLLEAMAMTKVMTDFYEVYSIQKGDVTFLAWISGDRVITKIQCW